MSLFGKKKEEKKESCGCGNCNTVKVTEESKTTDAIVKILGGGCAKCNQLEANTIEALKQLGMDTAIDHVKDYAKIASYGVMTTPALVYNEKVLCYGKILKADDIVALLQKGV